MNNTQHGILDSCHAWLIYDPHIRYGTQFDRFGLVYPPWPRHADCSGFCHSQYRTQHIAIGLDTGDIARDCAQRKAAFVDRRYVPAGGLIMHRGGASYNGGPDEHVGIVVLYEGAYVWTYESAGSGQGVVLKKRLVTWWTDGVVYPALLQGSPVDAEDDLTDNEKKLLFSILAKHDDMLTWLCAGEIVGGYASRSPGNLRTPKIQKKVGA